MSDRHEPSWQTTLLTAALVFVIALAGTAAAFAIWLQDLNAPQVAFLGSGKQLSLLVTDGPARLLLATGDDRIEFGNALAQVRPVFARRIDLLLLAGSGASLRAPLAISHDPHARVVATLGALPPSAEAAELAAIAPFPMPRHIQLGPSIGVTLETAPPDDADSGTGAPSWRATIERGEMRIVVLSDGAAVDRFDPGPPASVLAISGKDPLTAWNLDPAVVLVASADAIDGQKQRDAPPARADAPSWGYRVHPGEALRLRFVAGGIALPSEAANAMTGTPITGALPPQPPPAASLRRRERPWRARTRP